MAELPPEPGTWTIDSMHSFVTFTVAHFTVGNARGLASGPTGAITIEENPMESSVRATIDASTIVTGNKVRDEKIQGPDVLDVARYPVIDFASRKVSEESPGRYAVDGDLTVHGITRPVTLALAVHGVITDVWNKSRLGLTATTEIKRSDYDVLKFGHVALAGGGFMVPDSVQVTIEIEATHDEPRPRSG